MHNGRTSNATWRMPQAKQNGRGRERPWQIWLCACFLWVVSLCCFLLFTGALRSPIGGELWLLVSLTLNIVCAFGLLALQRWAFVASQGVAGLSVILSVIVGNPVAVILNLVFMGVLFSGLRTFFPNNKKGRVLMNGLVERVMREGQRHRAEQRHNGRASCPGCGKARKAPPPGRYRCKACGQAFVVEKAGTIVALAAQSS